LVWKNNYNKEAGLSGCGDIKMAYTILVVDDSTLTRAAIKRIIDMIGVEVQDLYEAGNGIEAFEILEKHTIDLVLADLNMPGMGGIELVQKMKDSENLSDVPVVVISTESSTTRVKQLIEDGIKDFLHKPFTPEEFRTVITRTLQISDG
jgi:two-component system chemotaxis response regulator CheY